MRRLVIEVVDDLCGGVFSETQTKEISLNYDGVEYALDLCTTCQLAAPTKKLSVLLTHARRITPERKKPTPGEWLEQFRNSSKQYCCPYDGCDYTNQTGRGLSRHYSSGHGLKLRDEVQGD